MKNKAILLFLVLAGLGMAQAPPHRTFKPQNMDAVRIWKLTEALELTEEQIVTFLPLVQIHERKLRDIQSEMQTLMEEGRTLLEQDKFSQKDVDRLTRRYNEKHAEIFQVKQDFILSLPDHLTPRQQLLYIGFEARFRKELRTYMKDQRWNRGQNRRDGRP